MKKLFTMLVIATFLTACTNEDDARHALNSAGFTEIEMTGYDWFSCSEDDFYNTGFRAKNPNGQIVEGTVCSGFLFKSSTIRY